VFNSVIKSLPGLTAGPHTPEAALNPPPSPAPALHGGALSPVVPVPGAEHGWVPHAWAEVPVCGSHPLLLAAHQAPVDALHVKQFCMSALLSNLCEEIGEGGRGKGALNRMGESKVGDRWEEIERGGQ